MCAAIALAVSTLTLVAVSSANAEPKESQQKSYCEMLKLLHKWTEEDWHNAPVGSKQERALHRSLDRIWRAYQRHECEAVSGPLDIEAPPAEPTVRYPSAAVLQIADRLTGDPAPLRAKRCLTLVESAEPNSSPVGRALVNAGCLGNLRLPKLKRWHARHPDITPGALVPMPATSPTPAPTTSPDPLVAPGR